MSSQPLQLSVIIPTCHRNDLLELCLEKLAPEIQNLPQASYEVIVSDDGRTSTAEQLILDKFPWAKWTVGPRKGPAANRNHGAAQATGKWLVFTDDDCIPSTSWLQSYLSAIKSTSSNVLEGKTSATGTRTRVDMEYPANETGGYLWSCNFAITRALFNEMNGFDENFPAPAMEDIEFHTRLKNAELKIPFVPDALVLHPWRLRKGFKFIQLQNKAEAYFNQKHPHAADRITFIKFFLDSARTMKRSVVALAPCQGRGFLRDVALSNYALLLQFKLNLLKS